MWKSALVLLMVVGWSAALTCYQGQQNNSYAVTGSAMQCPQNALSCIKSVDNATGIATRACQQTTCAQLFQLTTGAYQTNNATLPACQVSSGGLMCCCTGDGCNAASGARLMLGIFGLGLLATLCAHATR